jgi:hypothetical protein
LLLSVAHDLIEIEDVTSARQLDKLIGSVLVVWREWRIHSLSLHRHIEYLLVLFQVSVHHHEHGLLLDVVLNLALEDLNMRLHLLDATLVNLVLKLHTWQELLRGHLEIL